MICAKCQSLLVAVPLCLRCGAAQAKPARVAIEALSASVRELLVMMDHDYLSPKRRLVFDRAQTALQMAAQVARD